MATEGELAMKRMSLDVQLILIAVTVVPCALAAADLVDESFPKLSPGIQASVLKYQALASEELLRRYREMGVR